jgi:hypothetical protein
VRDEAVEERPVDDHVVLGVGRAELPGPRAARVDVAQAVDHAAAGGLEGPVGEVGRDVGRREDLVEVRVREREVDEGAREHVARRRSVGHGHAGLGGLEQPRRGVPRDLLEQVFLVPEVEVDRGRRVAELLRERAHRDALHPLAGDERERLFQDLLPERCMGFGSHGGPRVSGGCLRNGHNLPEQRVWNPRLRARC